MRRSIAFRACGWAVSLTLLALVTFGLWHSPSTMSKGASTAYWCLSRTAWASGLSWITLSSTANKNCWLTACLGWRGFRPFAKMAFSVLLVQGNVSWTKSVLGK